MLSSTSASDSGPSSGPTPSARALTWVGAVVAAAALLGAYEAALRRSGIRPSVTDDAPLWTVVRDEARGADRRTVALLGSSRIQGAFVPDVAREFGADLRFVQLAIDASFPVAVLRDLAEDESFRGVAVVSILPGHLSRRNWESQSPYVRRRAQGWTVADTVDRRLRTSAQERCALLAPEASPFRVIESLAKTGNFPGQSTRLDADRRRTTQFSESERARLAAARLGRDRQAFRSLMVDEDPDRWLDDATACDDFVRPIAARGGAVVFFHDRVTDEYRRVFLDRYPRETFWDRLAGRSAAVCIHADDVPEIAALQCPDGSHIDAADAPTFTRALMTELFRRGVLRR